MNKKSTWLSWSTGKDSAYTLYNLLKDPSFDVQKLFTTVTEDYDRVSMHSTRRKLLELQSESIGIPLEVVTIPKVCTNETYELVMKDALETAKKEGINYFAFGDLFLEDIREYREKNLSQTNIEPIFPIWKKSSTGDLARELINLGFKAYITCIDPKVLPASFAGRKFDKFFLADLPPEVDACGENGEFHTFVYDGPIFSRPIGCKVGEKVERDNFVFSDILPL